MIEVDFNLKAFGVMPFKGIAKLFIANVTLDVPYSKGDSYLAYYYEPASPYSDGERVWAFVNKHDRKQSMLQLTYKIFDKRNQVSRAEAAKLVGDALIVDWEGRAYE